MSEFMSKKKFDRRGSEEGAEDEFATWVIKLVYANSIFVSRME